MTRIFMGSSGKGYERLDAIAIDSERELQKLIADLPEIFGTCLLVARESPVADKSAEACRWRIDHLFVDAEAVPILVEVKRAQDTRIRREVVGQMLDYAANAIKYWPRGEMREKFKETCSRAGKSEDDVLGELLDEYTTAESFWDRVYRNLSEGRIKIVFVADTIPDDLKRIVEFLNEQMNSAEVFAVELAVYKHADELLHTAVPRIIGNTEKARSIKPPSLGPQTWPEALNYIENSDVKAFCEAEVALGKRRTNAKLRKIYYDCQGARRWRIQANKQDANIYQEMRFENDIDLWKMVFPSANIRTLDGNTQLAFNLATLKDLNEFVRTIEDGCSKFKFLKRRETSKSPTRN